MKKLFISIFFLISLSSPIHALKTLKIINKSNWKLLFTCEYEHETKYLSLDPSSENGFLHIGKLPNIPNIIKLTYCTSFFGVQSNQSEIDLHEARLLVANDPYYNVNLFIMCTPYTNAWHTHFSLYLDDAK